MAILGNDTISDPRELFVHQLKNVYFVEKTLAGEILPEMEGMIDDSTLKQAVSHHIDETKEQVANIEQIFSVLDVEPETEESPVLKGLKEEHDELMGMIDEDDTRIKDIVHSGVIAKNESVEIASYKGLITLAETLGEREIVSLLEQNLRQEESTLGKAEKCLKQLQPQMAGAGV